MPGFQPSEPSIPPRKVTSFKESLVATGYRPQHPKRHNRINGSWLLSLKVQLAILAALGIVALTF
ncbi:hypothetical protein [Sagittula sp. SSi028]|uniref:hypothetical protein n=1 Tax=Sagittula sp. SSi028 TaxID=3400636 RepID=UPI003AF956BD